MLPDCFNKIIANAIVKNVTTTPTAKLSECKRILDKDSPPIETKLRTLRDMTGNTHGIRFNIKPPIKAKITACNKVNSSNNSISGAFTTVDLTSNGLSSITIIPDISDSLELSNN